MTKYQIKTYNNIALEGLERFSKREFILNETNDPEGVILRSYNLHEEPINDSLLAVARAGAGYNNIPVDAMADAGVVVFNTPGANANSVKELVLSSMIAHSRNMFEAKDWADQLTGDDIPTQVEEGKSQFQGWEIRGKTMGVIGLGSIGHLVANDAQALGMNVIGYDPFISVEAAWKINQYVEQAPSLEEVLQKSDYISIHVPYTEDTHHLLDAHAVKLMKDHAVLLNFSRTDLIDEESVVEALNHQRLGSYITDFPNDAVMNNDKCVLLPHLGASTLEAESNSAIMAADQLKAYLQKGEITNSVNYPNVQMRMSSPTRISVCNRNVKNIIAYLTSLLSDQEINIDRIINKSRGDLAYTLVDIPETNEEKLQQIINDLSEQEGILKARLILDKKHDAWYQ